MIFKSKKKRVVSYIELVLLCVFFSVLILVLKLPSYLFVVLGFGFLIHMFVIELSNKK